MQHQTERVREDGVSGGTKENMPIGVKNPANLRNSQLGLPIDSLQVGGSRLMRNNASSIPLRPSEQFICTPSQMSAMRSGIRMKTNVVRVLDLDIDKVLDTEKAINDMGSIDLYKMMLPTFEQSSLIPQLQKLAHSINKKDWEQVKFNVHTIKSPAGYIGASRLHYACYYVQLAFSEQDFHTMLEYYPLVIETAIEVRHYIHLQLAKFQGRDNEFNYPDNLHQLPLADGYVIAKDPNGQISGGHGLYYCLNQMNNETLEQRMEKHYQQLKKPNAFQGMQGAQMNNRDDVSIQPLETGKVVDRSVSEQVKKNEPILPMFGKPQPDPPSNKIENLDALLLGGDNTKVEPQQNLIVGTTLSQNQKQNLGPVDAGMVFDQQLNASSAKVAAQQPEKQQLTFAPESQPQQNPGYQVTFLQQTFLPINNQSLTPNQQSMDKQVSIKKSQVQQQNSLTIQNVQTTSNHALLQAQQLHYQQSLLQQKNSMQPQLSLKNQPSLPYQTSQQPSLQKQPDQQSSPFALQLQQPIPQSIQQKEESKYSSRNKQQPEPDQSANRLLQQLSQRSLKQASDPTAKNNDVIQVKESARGVNQMSEQIDVGFGLSQQKQQQSPLKKLSSRKHLGAAAPVDQLELLVQKDQLQHHTTNGSDSSHLKQPHSSIQNISTNPNASQAQTGGWNCFGNALLCPTNNAVQPASSAEQNNQQSRCIIF